MKNKYMFFKKLYPDYVIVFNGNKSYGIDKYLMKYIKCNDINYVIIDNEFNFDVKKVSNNNYYKYVIREMLKLRVLPFILFNVFLKNY